MNESPRAKKHPTEGANPKIDEDYILGANRHTTTGLSPNTPSPGGVLHGVPAERNQKHETFDEGGPGENHSSGSSSKGY